MISEKRFWLHLVIFILLNQDFLVHSGTSAVRNGPRARRRLKISRPESATCVGAKLAPQKVMKQAEEYIIGDSQNAVDVVKLMLKQEKLTGEAENKRTLVKRFVNFLRSAYPLEMPMWSDVVQKRVRRSRGLQLRKRRFLIKSLRRKEQTGKDKEKPDPKMHTSSCGCKSVTECSEPDEPDKFRLFFSNPPLCRPTPTPNLPDIPLTDMCGHSCQCHKAEPHTTDNDKEIFVGHHKTTTETGV